MSQTVYAIIRTGGKQYRVQAGDVIQIEKVAHELGAEFQIPEVLLVGGASPVIGTPTVKGAEVKVVVTKHAETRKIIVFKKKRRHSFRKRHNHKQPFTEIFVKSIVSPNGEKAQAELNVPVVDVAQARKDRIAMKIEARQARVEAQVGKGRNAKADAAPAAKVAKKAAPKKKAGKKVAKKAAPKKKAAKKSKKA